MDIPHYSAMESSKKSTELETVPTNLIKTVYNYEQITQLDEAEEQ